MSDDILQHYAYKTKSTTSDNQREGLVVSTSRTRSRAVAILNYLNVVEGVQGSIDMVRDHKRAAHFTVDQDTPNTGRFYPT